MAKVGIPVAVFAFLIMGTVSATGDDTAGLSMDLPQTLAKMLPHLETFVNEVETDLIAIGHAYIGQDREASPGAGPEESLNELLTSVSALNEQLGEEADDQGLLDEVSNTLRQAREEAWSRATSTD